MRDYLNERMLDELLLVDEKMFSHIYGAVLNKYRGLNPLENLDSFLQLDAEGRLENNQPWYNSWPFGEKSNKTYNRFLGICRGRTGLRETLEAARKYGESIKTPNERFDFATAVIITDKWSSSTFKLYENIFLENAKHYNIWYVFILVTDHGYTQIPFLPNDRRALRDLEQNDELPTCNIVFYSESGILPAITNNYMFDLDCKKYTLDSNDGHRKGKLNDIAAKRFRAEIGKVISRGVCNRTTSNVMDVTHYNLNIPDVLDLHWDAPAIDLDVRIKEIHDAVQHLLKGIK